MGWRAGPMVELRLLTRGEEGRGVQGRQGDVGWCARAGCVWGCGPPKPLCVWRRACRVPRCASHLSQQAVGGVALADPIQRKRETPTVCARRRARLQRHRRTAATITTTTTGTGPAAARTAAAAVGFALGSGGVDKGVQAIWGGERLRVRGGSSCEGWVGGERLRVRGAAGLR
eukprot:819612-Prymnesium_polylepis.1